MTGYQLVDVDSGRPIPVVHCGRPPETLAGWFHGGDMWSMCEPRKDWRVLDAEGRPVPRSRAR